MSAPDYYTRLESFYRRLAESDGAWEEERDAVGGDPLPRGAGNCDHPGWCVEEG
ncbi:MAG: hypothetical protein ACQGVC_18030 [Myxococcota bacterium]